MKKDYTIGLDIGTSSVGWAVIDQNFMLSSGKKKINDNGVHKKIRTNLWGVDLFDEADKAAERRAKRSARRRILRRHERINYLRGIFEKHIVDIDESFFIRLDESFYQLDDKCALDYHYRDENGILRTKKVKNREIYKYPLFKTRKEELDYYKKFPTIYHLRNYLMATDEKADIRLIYLAMHHILKYRGHFVNQGQNFDLKNRDVAQSLGETLKLFGTSAYFNFGFDNIDNKDANNILKNNKISKSQKVYLLCNLYKLDADVIYLNGNESYVDDFELLTERQKLKYIDVRQKQIKSLFTAIVGNKIDIEKIFGKEEYSSKANESIPKDLYYRNEDFENSIEILEGIMQPEEVQVILEGKKVYEAIILSNILVKDTLSASMIEKYDAHKEELKKLKDIAKNVSKEFYDGLFHTGGIYSKYIDGVGNPSKKMTRDVFYKELKKYFEDNIEGLSFPKDDADFEWDGSKLKKKEQKFFEEIAAAMDCDVYLPKQRMSDNGVIPYQVHEYELVKIIENQGQFYDFLLDKSSYGEYKLQTLMKFRIPYYVGPLTHADNGEKGKRYSNKSQFAWMQKEKDEKITPWNFNDVVNLDASGVEFIERMTSYCTYLPNEKVLAKNTLLYQEFCLYNELSSSGYYENSHKHYFNRDKNLLTDIVKDLFKYGTKTKVTQEDMINYLENEKGIHTHELFGIDKRSVNGKPAFNNSMSSFHDLINMGIEARIIEDNRDLFDEIITWQTIFTDRETLKNRLIVANREWEILSEDQIGKLANKHYTGFGNLSKKLIDGIRDKDTGLTIIETLKAGGYHNFMRLVSGETAEQYSFKKQIENEQIGQNNGELEYDVVEQIAGSPAIKKGIWQGLKIVNELEKYLGKENISKIVIEMSRGEGKGRTKSRYNQLLSDYKKFEDANKEVFAELKSFEKNSKALNNEKLYLYFRQNGVDAYNKDHHLSIERLSDYEVDHIIPQCFLKDDSIDNKVLVGKNYNQQKGGNVPSQEIVNNMKSVWEGWLKAGLISQKKYEYLTTGKLTDTVKERFVNRQLVETRQIIKHIANILLHHFNDTDTVILTPKAGLTSQFREGKIYLLNPNYNEWDARQSPLHYNEKHFIEETLHNGFPKIRDINDYHHAHDAYLNAVVALYLYRNHPEIRDVWVYGRYQRGSQLSLGKWVVQRKNKSLQLLSDMRDEVWKQTDPDTGVTLEFNRDDVLANIEKTLDYKNINIVKKTEKQVGKFGDESVFKKDLEMKSVMLSCKNNLNPAKYGGTKSPISAFSVVVKNDKGKVMAKSVPVMMAEEYLLAEDKLEFMKKLYPKDRIDKVLVEEVDKYTRFDNLQDGKKISRLVASYKEGQKAKSLVLSVNDLRGLKSCNEATLMSIYDKIYDYLCDNAVYSETALMKWNDSIRKEFNLLSAEEKRTFIEDSFSIVKRGTTNAKGCIKGKIGASSGQQQHTNVANDVININSTLIYQSVTGLFETRKSVRLMQKE